MTAVGVKGAVLLPVP